MLEDRSYMRREPEFRPSVCIALIVVLVLVFLVQHMGAQRAMGGERAFNEYFALNKAGLLKGPVPYFWQLLTFQFLHSGPLHLILNCLTLYFIGREVERAVGGKSFLKLYLCSGIVGGLLQAVMFFLPIAGPNANVVGASAGIAGVFAAFALLFPHQEVMFFFLPFRFKVQYVFWVLLGISVVGTILPFGGVAHAAHLGGMAAGYGFLRWATQAEGFFAPRGFRRGRVRPRELVPLGKGSPWQRTKRESNDMPAEEFISREVDPILDKISAHGIQSLTPRERQILEAARAKMERR